MDFDQQRFIQNLRNFRRRCGFSQARLAELCDVSTGTIGNIESGKKNPSLPLIFAIARAMNINAYKLFVFDEDDKSIEKNQVSFSPLQISFISSRLRMELDVSVSKIAEQLLGNMESEKN